MNLRKILLGALIATAGASSIQADDNEAGSLLVYPDWVNIADFVSLITVTNTNANESVTVEVIYIDSESCSEFNRTFELTPLDTATFLSAVHNPDYGYGYAYAFAKDSATGEPISFNYLIGDSQIVNPYEGIHYSLNPSMFQAIGRDGSDTDLNGDGLRNLDGTEYSMAPDEIVVPRFWAATDNSVTVLTLISLTGGAQFSTTVDFLIYNDNEQGFSSEFTFECHTRVSLPDISWVFSRQFLENYTNDDPNEVQGWENSTGWFIMDGAVASSSSTSIADPAVLGYVTHIADDYVFPASRGKGYHGASWSSQLPFHRGEQSNGSLLSRSLTGE